MNDTSTHVQICSELAMAIGNSLDLSVMLEDSLSAYLEKLHCHTAMVATADGDDGMRGTVRPVFSIPAQADSDGAVAAALARINAYGGGCAATGSADYSSGQTENGNTYYVMDLPDFGYLVLVMDGGSLTPRLLKCLVPLNAKLARAARFCREWDRAVHDLPKLRRAVDQSPMAVLIMSIDGAIEYMNSRFSQLTGMHPIDAAGKNARAVFSLAAVFDADHPCRQCLLAGQSWEGEIAHQNADGKRQWLHAMIAPVRDDGGTITHAIAYFEDISWRKRTEKQLRQAQVDLESARRVRDQFLSNMSHELRTPINGIVGMAGLLKDTQLTRDQMDMAATIQVSATALISIIDDLLDYAQVAASQLDLTPTIIQLDQMIDLIRRQTRARIGTKPIDLTVSLDPAVPLEIRGDQKRLRQVLDHLLGNAAKFTDTGTIAVAVECVGNSRHHATLRFSISDTGPGIPAEFQEHLFESFSQLDTAFHRRHGGTGMGLAICKAVVEKMGGRIDCRSELGKGTTFSFTVVVAVVPGASSTEGAAPRILVAEDNLINRMFTLKILENLGYQADAVDNGRDAIEAVGAGSYDLMIMDIQMPELDGIEVTRRIRADTTGRVDPHIPIIALSALSEEEYRQTSLDAGIDVFVAKPVSAGQLAALIKDYLPDHGADDSVLADRP